MVTRSSWCSVASVVKCLERLFGDCGRLVMIRRSVNLYVPGVVFQYSAECSCRPAMVEVQHATKTLAASCIIA